MSKVGRPTRYTKEIGDIICEGISRRKSLASLCDGDDSMPAPRTVYSWLRQYEEFQHNYTMAQEDKADFIAEDVLDVADDETLDPADKRIRVDARKWLSSKYKPKKYGDRIQQDVNVATNDLDEIEKVKAFLEENGIDITKI